MKGGNLILQFVVPLLVIMFSLVFVFKIAPEIVKNGKSMADVGDFKEYCIKLNCKSVTTECVKLNTWPDFLESCHKYYGDDKNLDFCLKQCGCEKDQGGCLRKIGRMLSAATNALVS